MKLKHLFAFGYAYGKVDGKFSCSSSSRKHHSICFVSQVSHRCTTNSQTLAALATPESNVKESQPRDTKSDGSAFSRAAEITKIVGGQVLSPLLGSIILQGLPNDGGWDWDHFWSRRNSIRGATNAERLAKAMEELGPTYVKFGQALGSRPDVVPPALAQALSGLQDNMQPFDTSTARQIMEEELNSTSADPTDVRTLVESISDEPIAAASVGQVYKGMLPNRGPVAVKVQRPGIRPLVERDAALLRTLASWIESIPALPNNKQQGKVKRLVNTDVLDAAEEFMSRVFEELDYEKEAQNAAKFASLYGSKKGTSRDVSVVVPEIYSDLCTENVLVMEWIDGTKLTSVQVNETEAVAENLALVEIAIQATLSQLLVTGVLHADPHAGNLLKVGTDDNEVTLGYLDFGLLSTIPEQVRDALVCSVAYLVFAKDIDAIANLFGELELMPVEVLEDKEERAALAEALEQTMAESLQYPEPDENDPDGTRIPKLRFDKLLDALARLVPRFKFRLPPYFINNARALSTLEGIAISLDPSFNVLQVLYPYALNRLFQNPSKSPVVETTLQDLIRSPTTGRVDRNKVKQLLEDSALLTGFRKRRVVWDVLKSRGGQKLVFKIAAEELNHRVAKGYFGRRKRKKVKTA